MMERDIDFELIMALAEGTLPPEEAAAAERALDAEGRAELEAQRLAVAALAEAPAVSLTVAERQDLRRSVRLAINLTPPASTAPAASPAPRLWRWLPGLAGAAALVLVVGIGISNRGGDDSGDEAALADTASAETTEAASQLQGNQLAEESIERAGADPAAEGDAEFEGAAPVAADSANDDGDQATSTTAAATTLAPPGAYRAQLVATDLGGLDSSDPEAIRDSIEQAQLDEMDFFPYSAEFLNEAAAGLEFLCWADLEFEPDDQVLLIGVAELDGIDVELYVIEPATDDTVTDDTANFLAIADCISELELDPTP